MVSTSIAARRISVDRRAALSSVSPKLSVKYMRYLIALVFCVLLALSQAHACLGPSGEKTLFFKAIPNPPPDADVIAEVDLLDVSVLDLYKGEAKAKVLRVIRPAAGSLHEGGILSLKFLVSSCGPNHRSGDKGTIVAKVGTDSAGRLVWYPYTYRNSDGMFWSPSINK